MEAKARSLARYEQLEGEGYEACCAGIPVTLVSELNDLSRPEAANAGLDAARGEYLLFLDDDDWIAPEHVAQLLPCLESDSNVGLAYSSTQKTDADGTLIPDVFDITYDPARLRRDNFIPIHSALFRRALVSQGCRFDEQFDIFEDWDFWLQLSRLTSFRHVNQVTAFYRQGGDSNTAAEDEAARYLQNHPIALGRAKLFDKWLPRWSGTEYNLTLHSLDQPHLTQRLQAEIKALDENLAALGRENAAAHNELRGLNLKLNRSLQTLNRRDAELHESRAHAQRVENDLKTVLGSFSWRITRPYRSIKFRLDRFVLNPLRRNLLLGRASTAMTQSESSNIAGNLDIPGPTQDEFTEQVIVQGWCYSREGIREIQAWVDDDLQSSFSTGISRPDIAEAHPELKAAFDCGFYQEIALPQLPAGTHRLELRIIDNSGDTRRLDYEFQLFKSRDLYNSWYCRNLPDDAEVQRLRDESSALAAPEVFHLVIDSGSSPEDLLLTLASLQEQGYSHWHAHIPLASKEARARLLGDFDQGDLNPSNFIQGDRLRFYSDLNQALTHAEECAGWLGLLRAGETLAPHALWEFAGIAAGQSADLIYSDHDQVGPSGAHLEPVFTFNWAPDYLLSTNYVGEFFFTRRRLPQRKQQIDLGNQAWRYAYLLAAGEVSTAIKRIAKVLWTAPLRTEQSETAHFSAEAQVVASALRRQERDAEIITDGSRRYVKWKLDNCPRVSIIIPTMGKLELLKPCIESLQIRTTYPNFEIIILDNSRGRNREGIEYLRDKGLTLIECDEAFNWSRLNNTGARHANGELLLFLNDDMEVIEDNWLHELVRQAVRPEIGAVGGLLFYPNGALQHTGVLLVDYGGGGIHLLHKRMPGPGIYRRLDLTVREVTANTGACLMVSTDKFNAVEGFDEELAVVGNDVDFCLRLIKQGYRNLWTPACRLIHHESISRKAQVPKADEKAMWLRWGERFTAGDDYYNPNLSTRKCDFSLDTSRLARISEKPFPASGAGAGGGAETQQRLLPGVNLIGYTRAEMGIGEGARSDARCLDAANEAFGIICFQSGNPSRMTDMSWRHKEVNSALYDINLLHINPDHALQAIAELPESYFRDHYTIGYWAWELPEIPPAWLETFKHVDEVWVPSGFVQQAVSMHSPVPVLKMPHAIEVKTDPEVNRDYFGLPENAFLFLTMFDTHSRSERKNPYGAIEAFKQAFAPDDMSARLILKVNNPTDEAIRQIKQAIASHRNIQLLEQVLTRPRINDLIASCDCYVSLHRSEGFGLVPAEAMALGKIALLTNWSGNTEYMTKDNCVAIDYKLVTLEENYGIYKAGQVWAEPDLQHAAASMRELVTRPEWAREIGRQARLTIEQRFAPSVIGHLMQKRLAAIRAWRARGNP